jgi:hypothetical protein
LRQAATVQPVEQRESVCGATCGCGGTAVKELSTESPRLAARLRSAWDGQ